MTTVLRAPATAPQATPPLDLDARLALIDATMTVRLDEAAAHFEIRTAHVPGADPIPDLANVVPLTPTLTPAASHYSTPLADVLHRARIRLETHGWLRGQLRDDQAEARCLYGAVRIEASSAGQVDDACALLLETIRRDYPDAESIPNWNDNQPDANQPIRYLDRAAQLAADRHL